MWDETEEREIFVVKKNPENKQLRDKHNIWDLYNMRNPKKTKFMEGYMPKKLYEHVTNSDKQGKSEE
jgi:hypothetical protein